MIPGLSEAIAAAGLGNPEITPDGGLHRFHVEGDRPGTRNGWYVAHANGVPAGAFGSWKTGDVITWCEREKAALSAAERAAFDTLVKEAKEQRDAERKRVQGEAENRARAIWKDATPAPGNHPYLIAKGIEAHGARVHKDRLVIPVQDSGGNLRALQFIGDDGDKRFLRGSAVGGHYYTIGRPVTVIYVCEGFATAATIHKITEQMAVVAFNAGNLRRVAETMKAQHPGLELVIAADNDTGTEGNPGLKKAQEAARAVGGMVAVPQFPAGTAGTDFNDLCRLQGREETRKQLEALVDIKDQFESSTRPDHGAADRFVQRQKVDALAKLDLIAYDQQRTQVAKELACRTTTLDKLVAQRRQEIQDEAKLSSIAPDEVEPWPDPVDGVDLLNEIADTLTRFAVLPDHADTAIALWVVFSYLHEHAYVCPLLGLMSPEKRCGKTTVISLLSRLVCRPLAASNISTSALFRAVERWQPCLLVDEADTFVHSSDELRGVLNSGHTRDTAFVVRTVGDDHEPKRFSTWGPKVFALIGSLPDTLQDRSVVIWLERKTVDQKVERYRRHHAPELLELRRRAARWANDNAKQFAEAKDCNLTSLNDRAADNWEPLLQIAELVGGIWPQGAHKAAIVLSGAAGVFNKDSIRTELLADIRRIFADLGDDRINSTILASQLELMEDRPWPEFKRGSPITPPQIAELLKPFGIRPKGIRFGARSVRGYTLDMFVDTFARYLPPAGRNTATTDSNQ